MEETPTGSTVFVVHGRNLALRDSLFSFLRALKLDPREWEEWVRGTGSAAPYVGQVLDHAFATAQAVVVLLTPDDEAQLRDELRNSNEPPYETQLTGQARPNVLFEAGMAFGRQPERTVLIEVGSLRPFSDIGGRLVIRLDNSAAKRNDLATRLENAGCEVVRSGSDWLSTGDFSVPTPKDTGTRRAEVAASDTVNSPIVQVRLKLAGATPVPHTAGKPVVVSAELVNISAVTASDVLYRIGVPKRLMPAVPSRRTRRYDPLLKETASGNGAPMSLYEYGCYASKGDPPVLGGSSLQVGNFELTLKDYEVEPHYEPLVWWVNTGAARTHGIVWLIVSHGLVTLTERPEVLATLNDRELEEYFQDPD